MFKAKEAKKPTILQMIDRNELEDQMLKNLAALGVNNVAHGNRISTLNKLLDEKGDVNHPEFVGGYVWRHSLADKHRRRGGCCSQCDGPCVVIQAPWTC